MKIVIIVAFADEINPIVKRFNLKGPKAFAFTKRWIGQQFTLYETRIG